MVKKPIFNISVDGTLMSAMLVISVKIYTYFWHVLKHISRVRISKFGLLSKREENKTSEPHSLSSEVNAEKENVVVYPFVLGSSIYAK